MAAALYSLWSILGVLLAYNVFRPFRSKNIAWFTFLVFAFGWLVGDLVFHWIAFNLIITYLFYLLDVFDSDWIQALFVVNVAAWACLILRFQGLQRLRPLVDQQMLVALGVDYEQSLNPQFHSPLPAPAFDWKTYCYPFRLFRDPRVKISRDIVYFSEDDITLRLDVIQPRSGVTQAPILMQIHGGGWTIGTKETQAVPLMTRMAAQGWVCITVQYRLSPRAIFPDHIIDCKRALCWIKKHAHEFGGDPNFIVTTGGSAGGHLSSLMAVSANEPSFQPGFEELDTTVQGCVSYYGIYDFFAPFGPNSYPAFADLLKVVMRATPASNHDLYQKASPIKWISPATPPFMVIQGEVDALVAVEEAQRFVKALQAAKNPNLVYLQLPMLEHAFDNLPTIATHYVISAVEKYLTLLRTQYQARQSADH